MMSAGLLSATAKTCAWYMQPENLKSGATCFAVRAQSLFDNLSIFSRGSRIRWPRRQSRATKRSAPDVKMPVTRNIPMLSTKVMR
jgi:hypothetical protein